MTHLVKRAPPLIPQQLHGIIEAKRSQPLYNESCDRSALMMPRAYCWIKGGAHLINCIIICHIRWFHKNNIDSSYTYLRGDECIAARSVELVAVQRTLQASCFGIHVALWQRHKPVCALVFQNTHFPLDMPPPDHHLILSDAVPQRICRICRMWDVGCRICCRK